MAYRRWKHKIQVLKELHYYIKTQSWKKKSWSQVNYRKLSGRTKFGAKLYKATEKQPWHDYKHWLCVESALTCPVVSRVMATTDLFYATSDIRRYQKCLISAKVKSWLDWVHFLNNWIWVLIFHQQKLSKMTETDSLCRLHRLSVSVFPFTELLCLDTALYK